MFCHVIPLYTDGARRTRAEIESDIGYAGQLTSSWVPPTHSAWSRAIQELSLKSLKYPSIHAQALPPIFDVYFGGMAGDGFVLRGYQIKAYPDDRPHQHTMQAWWCRPVTPERAHEIFKERDDLELQALRNRRKDSAAARAVPPVDREAG